MLAYSRCGIILTYCCGAKRAHPSYASIAFLGCFAWVWYRARKFHKQRAIRRRHQFELQQRNSLNAGNAATDQTWEQPWTGPQIHSMDSSSGGAAAFVGQSRDVVGGSTTTTSDGGTAQTRRDAFRTTSTLRQASGENLLGGSFESIALRSTSAGLPPLGAHGGGGSTSNL